MVTSSAFALALVMAATPVAQIPVGACEISSAEVSWGFKESFRSYISGSIALGTWTTSGDVGYQTPVFSFSGGEGYLLPDLDGGEVAFDGELLFEGHGGILSTTLANPRLEFVGPREAVLFLDVAGDTMESVSIAATGVEFVTLRWSGAEDAINSETGEWVITGAEATLTQAGSDAFGTYLAGEVFDPMDIAITVKPSCVNDREAQAWWLAAVAVGLVGAGAGALVLSRRGRKSPEPERQ